MSSQDTRTSQELATTDPVCGMSVDPKTALCADHDGHTYHFCSAHCREKFRASPGSYLPAGPAGHEHAEHAHHGEGGEREPGPRAQPTGQPTGEVAEYTCPMHPQIRQPGPGACPICGMALEPVMVTADTGPSAELLDMTRRFWIGVALTIPVVLLEMGGDLLSWVSDLVPPQVSVWLQLVLATPVVLWCWLAVLRARLGLGPYPQPQHVHTHRDGHRSGVALQRRRHVAPGIFPVVLASHGRDRRRLLRGGRGHHRARPARTGPRAAGTRADLRSDQGPAGPDPEDGAAGSATMAATSRSR